MNNQAPQSVNSIVCNLNTMVDAVNALVHAAELMLAGVPWRNTPEGCEEASRQISHVHCLLCIAKERAAEAVAQGNLADSATLNLCEPRAA